MTLDAAPAAGFDLDAGARNLLLNCAQMQPGQSLQIERRVGPPP